MGDSITAGSGGTGINANRFPDQALATYIYPYLYTNDGVGGRKCQDMIDNAAAEVDPHFNALAPLNAAHLECGTNDYGTGTGQTTNPATTYAKMLTWVAARQAVGWSVVVFTLSDSSVVDETFRATLNASITGGAVANGYKVADVGSDSHMGCNGCFSDTTYFLDGTHPTVIGNQIYATYLESALTAIGVH